MLLLLLLLLPLLLQSMNYPLTYLLSILPLCYVKLLALHQRHYHIIQSIPSLQKRLYPFRTWVWGSLIHDSGVWKAQHFAVPPWEVEAWTEAWTVYTLLCKAENRDKSKHFRTVLRISFCVTLRRDSTDL
jgi:hypothetical protein